MSEARRPPRVTEWDREYMRRLGEFERQARAEHLAYLRSLSLGERLRRSFAATARQRGRYARKEPKDLAAFYQRAKRLGLYRE